MKTKEELNELKEEVVTPNEKLQELTEEQLGLVYGGLTYIKEGKDSQPQVLTDKRV